MGFMDGIGGPVRSQIPPRGQWTGCSTRFITSAKAGKRVPDPRQGVEATCQDAAGKASTLDPESSEARTVRNGALAKTKVFN